MRVLVFAALKEYFDREFDIPGEVRDMAGLRSKLLEINPASGELLKASRFAVNELFIDNDFIFREYDTVVILPPASGG